METTIIKNLAKPILELLDLKYKEIKDIDAERNDLLHIIEFLDLPANKMVQVYKKLKLISKKRRVIKEEVSTLQSIVSFIESPELNKKELKRHISNLEESKKSFEKYKF